MPSVPASTVNVRAARCVRARQRKRSICAGESFAVFGDDGDLVAVRRLGEPPRDLAHLGRGHEVPDQRDARDRIRRER